MISKEKLKEILKEIGRPKKYEAGFVDARRIVSDGLSIIGLDATDILGFAKEANETRTRRTKGSQAWFKKMYEDGWRFKGMFEYEGLKLLYGGFVIMERELPNKRLQELIETLSDEKVIRTSSALEIDRGPELPQIVRESPDNMQPLPSQFKIKKNVGEGVGIKDVKIIPLEERMQTTKDSLKKMGYKEEEIKVYKSVQEPKEGFESEIVDFIVDAQEGMKSIEELFFNETGKNAIWRGTETKAFKNWKEARD